VICFDTVIILAGYTFFDSESVFAERLSFRKK